MDTHKPKKHAKTDSHKSMKKDGPATAALHVINDESPTKDHKKTRTPTSILPSVASSAIGKYTVQVASYATETEAKSHAADLKGKGFSAFYIPATIKGKTWYRVSVGLFINHRSAMNFQKELKAQSNITSSLVQKIVK